MILFVGVGIAGFSGYLVMQEFNRLNQQITGLKREAAKVVPTREVFIANEELAYGRPIEKEKLKRVMWPEKLLPEGFFDDEETLFGTEDQPLQRLVIKAMDAGDLILASKVTQPGQDAGIVSRLGIGLRAFTLKVDVSNGSFIRPGDLVDVFWTGRDRGETATRLILDGVELIAINSDTETGSRVVGSNQVARTITVAVPPETVARLVQAQASGKLVVSLRGIGDTESAGEIRVDQSDFLGIEEQVEEEVQKVEECFTIVRRGTESIRQQIPCSQ
ncbi:MAG: Flp pilus assembly protein CpaB [Pseudomonadota bacterium]